MISTELDQSENSDGSSRDRRRGMAAAIALAVIPLLYFLPVVLGGYTLSPGDGLTQNMGVRVLIGEMLRNGQLPLWNPYIFAGTPLLASVYPGALYPPNWLFAILTPTAAMNLVVVTTYHLALIGTYLFGRRIGMTRAGAMAAGMVFTFGGFMIAHMGHTSRIAAAAWLPWILLSIEHHYRRASWKWAAIGAVCIALQLFAGEPQMNFYTILVCGAYGLYSLWMREEVERRSRFLWTSIGMSICGLLLSMPQLLPERELLNLGERAGITYDYFAGYSFAPGKILTFLFPFFYGGGTISPYKVEYWGQSTIDETCGYFGLLALLLGLTALFRAQRRSMAWFWGLVALASLIMAFGGYLPLRLNRIFYHLPIYNLFRAQARHMFEFTFCAGILAGLGLSELGRSRRKGFDRPLWLGALTFAGLIAGATLIYCFFSGRLPSSLPLPKGAGSIANAEALVPLFFAALSLAALMIYARWRTTAGAVLLLATIFADLTSFSIGFNYGWRNFVSDTAQRLADPPAVQFIKSREPDLNAFRIISYSSKPYGQNYRELNFPNVSIVRGLQTVNGYDALRLPRPAAVAGQMGIDGVVGEVEAFGSRDQGLNLLGVKYLLLENQARGPEEMMEIDGVRFDRDIIDVSLDPGDRIDLPTEGATASELALVTIMGGAANVADETVVARVNLYAKDGQVIEREIRAGRDTAEWSYDRDDVRPIVKHRLAPIAESWTVEGSKAHRYLARIPFPRAAIERIEFKYMLPNARLLIQRATLADPETQGFKPLGLMRLDPERWRKLEQFGQIEVYENLKSAPRAWFVRRATAMLAADVLETIKTGKLKDGAAFDPAETVLFQDEDFGGRDILLPDLGEQAKGEARLTRYEPQRIELQTHNPNPGFLVLSEIYYRGWEAWIDGRRAPVEKVDYVLRGLMTPAGDHKIEFRFRAHSFWNGFSYGLLGIFFLLVGSTGRRQPTMRILALLDRLQTALLGAALAFWSKGTHAFGRTLSPVIAFLVDRRFHLFLGLIAAMLFGSMLIQRSSHGVRGSDSAGYASTARSIAHGSATYPVTTTDRLGLSRDYIQLFIPHAYVPIYKTGRMFSIYPIGFPIHIVIASWLAGWEWGPYLVNPICAVISLIMMYLVARKLGLPDGYAVAGSLILACNVTFLVQSIYVMSDVPAICWALLAIWTALKAKDHPAWAAAAGAAFGMGFLIRPTGILLALPILFCLPRKPKTWIWFIVGGLPLAAVFMIYNTAVTGNPLIAGYQAIGLHGEIGLRGSLQRLEGYFYWVGKAASPLIPLGWVALAFLRGVRTQVRVILLAWFGSFLLFYSCYSHFYEWWFCRFILPGYPALIIGALFTAQRFIGWIKKSVDRRLGPVIALGLLVVVVTVEVKFSKYYRVLNSGPLETMHADYTRWVDQSLPPNALIVSTQMTGALHYYTQRPFVRFDFMTPEIWRTLQDQARERGLEWYGFFEEFELPDAKKATPGKWTQLGECSPMSLWRIEPMDSSLTQKNERETLKN